MKLNGKTALVTGASRGIGAEIALALAEQGASVACLATTRDNALPIVDKIRTAGGTAEPLGARVEERAEVEAAFRDAEAALGAVNILVNNAGVSCVVPFLELEQADWERTLAINMGGVFLCSQVAARRMKDVGGGAIIHIGSVSGINGFPHRLAYCASKAGVHHMTKVMAIDLAEHGIRVNCVAPGYTSTDMIEELEKKGLLAVDKIRARIPMGDLAKPRDVADAVVYLAGGESRYITGATLVVDGGFAAYGFL